MNTNISNTVLVISGPTASGKSYLAELLIQKYPSSVILNADSMQVYKDLPILSNQPDIHTESEIYKLYGFLDFDKNCSAGFWQETANDVIEQSFKEKKLPIIVGGTGLYIRVLLEGIADIPDIKSDIRQHVQERFLMLGKEKFYAQLSSIDPISARRIHSNDSYRMQRAMEVYIQTGKSIADFKNSKSLYDALHISILPNRDKLYQNCNVRLQAMLDAGAIYEVESLFKKIRKKPNKYNIENTLGYRNIVSYLKNEINLDEAITQAAQATRNYAKRQYTWFKNQLPNKTILSYDSDIKEIQENFLKMVKPHFI